MSRVESRPTWELWGMSKELWIEYLKDSYMMDELIFYYSVGIEMMEAVNRDVLGTNKYSEIVGTDLEKGIAERNKTIEFYILRLSELKGKQNEQK